MTLVLPRSDTGVNLPPDSVPETAVGSAYLPSYAAAQYNVSIAAGESSSSPCPIEKLAR